MKRLTLFHDVFANLPRAYRSPAYHASWLGAVILVVALGLLQLSIVRRVQDQVFDLYQRAAPRTFDPASPVRVVDIDDASIAKLGQWPWSRTQIADLIDRLHQAGATTIAFDIVFSEPDRTSAEAFLASIPDNTRRAAVRAALGDVGSNDERLARAIRAAPVVLGLALTQTSALPAFMPPYGVAAAGEDPKVFVPRFSGAVVPLTGLADQASGLGALNWLPDGDQIVRRVPLMLAAGNRLVPSLALESLRLAQGASTYLVRASAASGDDAVARGVQSVRVGAFTLPTERSGDIRLQFSLHRPERFIPAWQVLDGSVSAAELDGRMVIVGSSSAGLADIRATPVDPAMPGVEIQAQALEGLLSQARLLRPSWSVLELYAGVLGAVALAAILPVVAPVAGAVLLIFALGATVSVSWWAFAGQHLLLDPVLPSLTIIAAYLGAISALFRLERLDRRFVQDAFGRFVSPDVVAQLARGPGQLALGGETRPLTVMFTDVRNFSAFAERMSAQDLTRFMNRYLSPMSEIVLAHGGTIDKYIGDAIMAFWNAPLPDPDHARHAARTALAMLAALPKLQSDTPGLPPLRCGIGIASGPCVVGNLGSNFRFDYSALGDDVNLASRLESLTKMYGLDILATEATRQMAPDLAWLEVDTVVVAGREAPTSIATLLGDETVAVEASFQGLRKANRTMLALYEAGKFEAAAQALIMLRAAAPELLAKMYDVYAERCRSNLLLPVEDRADSIMRLSYK